MSFTCPRNSCPAAPVGPVWVMVFVTYNLPDGPSVAGAEFVGIGVVPA